MKTSIALSAALLAVASFGFAHEGEEHADGQAGHDHAQTEKQKRTDAAMVAAQKICPVTGLDLDAMGGPVKAKSADGTVFLCCKSCVGKSPKPAAVAQIRQNLVAAQGICPIMKKPLPADAASVVVEGRKVFVCCKPCTEKVKADPAKALAVVDAQLAAHAAAEQRAATK